MHRTYFLRECFLLSMVISIVLLCNHATAEEQPNCAEPPIDNPEQAICYAQWHARVISEVSAYGYEYNAEQEKGNWVVKIVEQNPEKDTRIFTIRAIDGSLIESGAAPASSPEKDSSLPEEEQDKWYVGPRLGLSAFTGLIGIEAQKRHLGLTAGFPYRIGIKYYFAPYGHSAFVGSFFSYYTFDDDGNDVERTEVGVGSGYRWRWRQAWDLELGLSLVYIERREEEPFSTDTDKHITILPAIAFGYSF